MVTNIQVALNGTMLHTLDPSIIIQGIDEQAPSWTPNAVNSAGLVGQHFTTLEKRYRDVTISFAIKKQATLAARRAIYEKVCAWAAPGGRLTVNYRPGLELRVVCIAIPALANITQWGNPMTITFRAYNIPQWIDTNVTIADTDTAAMRSSVQLTVAATGGGKLWASVYNSSGDMCNWLQIVTTNGIIAFSDLGLAGGESLHITYSLDDIQAIQIRNGNTYRSAMAKRTTASVDDIWLVKGSNTIHVYAPVPVVYSVSTYGRWI